MKILIGMDDTDNLHSRGTGRLARGIAATLGSGGLSLLGVTRHQLLVDPRIPYTSHNSSATLHLEGPQETDLAALFAQVKALMLADFQEGSDPGLCVGMVEAAQAASSFGQRAQRELVTQAEARQLAQQAGLLLEGLGGTQDGVIGALAAVGLAATGEDGRYLSIGHIRDLAGIQPVAALLQAGVARVCTEDGQPVLEGLVLADKVRPACRGGQPVQFVAWEQEYWVPLKIN